MRSSFPKLKSLALAWLTEYCYKEYLASITIKYKDQQDWHKSDLHILSLKGSWRQGRHVCFGSHVGPVPKNHNFLFYITTGVLFNLQPCWRFLELAVRVFPHKEHHDFFYTVRACEWTYQKGTEQGTAEKS